MLTFAHPWFLAALAALAVPPLLHLMGRRATVRLRFPLVHFITPAPLPREGRRRLRDVLLLLLRLAILAAAVLCLAGPAWQPPQGPAAAGAQPDEIVFVVDLSASMGGWDSAAQLRQTILGFADTHRGARLGLVSVSDRVVRSLSPASGRAVFVQALADLRPEPVAGTPGLGIREALRLFAPHGRRVLCLVSDFQESDWQGADLPRLPAGIAVECLPTSAPRLANAGIVAARVFHLPDQEVRITATVRNFGDAAVTTTLSVQAGSQSQQREIRLPARAVREAQLVLRHSAGAQGELTLGPDPYAADNHFFLWLGQPAAVPLVAVVPAELEREKQQEFFFLRKAVEAVADAAAPLYRLDSVDPSFFGALDLTPFPVLFLLGAGGYLQEADWIACRQFVERGGWLVCTPGARSLEQLRGLDAHGLTVATFRGVALAKAEGRTTPWAVDWVNPEGAFSRLADQARGTELLSFAILRYLRLEPAADSRVLLQTAAGDPLLLERRVGRGRVLLAAFAFETTWTELPVTTAFVPLAQELVRAAAPADAGTVRIECGQALPSDGRFAAALAQPQRRANPVVTRTPGVQVVDGIPLEVNVPRRESVLEQTAAPQIVRRLTGTNATAMPEPVVTDSAGKLLLAPFLAVLAALAFLGELLITGWLDLRAAAGRPAGQGIPAGGDA